MSTLGGHRFMKPLETPAETLSQGERELFAATRPFIQEDRAASWRHTLTGIGLLAASLAAIVLVDAVWARALLSVLAGLLIVRCFILYHDYMHGSLLGGSRFAAVLFPVYGVLTLNPPRIWRETHNYHHLHTARIAGSHIGSYPVVTTAQWRRMPPRQRLYYRLTRHPLTLAAGYLTVFLSGMCVRPFLRQPRQYFDSGLALLLHLLLLAAAWSAGGFELMLFAVILPQAIASAVGSYIFYVQHNFPEVEIRERADWTYTAAALHSSAFIEMGPVARWFLGNIGFHHVHHLNPRIPFYRLPDAMQQIPELRDPPRTSLAWRDIVTSFRLKLWDPERGEMVGYPSDASD
jgi:omega-6 fatty acid desaturase (delta-12 desaturase)